MFFMRKLQKNSRLYYQKDDISFLVMHNRIQIQPKQQRIVINLWFPSFNSAQYYGHPQNTLLSRYARKHRFV